jgi:hypothetical protein
LRSEDRFGIAGANFFAETQPKRLINGRSKNEIAAQGRNSSQATLRLVAEKSYGTTYEASEKNCAQVFSRTVRVAAA